MILLSALLSAAAAEPATHIAVHGGLLQPLLLDGFNAAVDVRRGRLVTSYSHGEGLDLTDVPGILPDAQRDLGVAVRMPWTTGGGVGVLLVDELYVMADLKAHRIEVDTGLSPEAYTTVTLGGEIGYRLSVWEGLYVCPVIRYWPNVWSSAPDGLALSTAAGDWQHDPMEQGYSGLFANVLVGWDFDLSGSSRSRR